MSYLKHSTVRSNLKVFSKRVNYSIIYCI